MTDRERAALRPMTDEELDVVAGGVGGVFPGSDLLGMLVGAYDLGPPMAVAPARDTAVTAEPRSEDRTDREPARGPNTAGGA